MPRLILAALLAGACAFFPTSALAQDPAPPLAPLDQRIAPFVVDARIAMPRLNGSASVADSLGVAEGDLPTRGFGLVLGGHFYPVRGRSIALGIGGEVLLRAQGSKTVAPALEDGPDGPTIVTRVSAITPQVSLNFGRRNGYSYLTGGIGMGSLTTELEDRPVAGAESRPRILNYGGGARWFIKKHLAFNLDLRFYKIGSQEAGVNRPAYPASTMMTFSAGISSR